MNTAAGLILVYKRPAENFNFALNWYIITSVTSPIQFFRKAGWLEHWPFFFFFACFLSNRKGSGKAIYLDCIEFEPRELHTETVVDLIGVPQRALVPQRYHIGLVCYFGSWFMLPRLHHTLALSLVGFSSGPWALSHELAKALDSG